ncbi:MAG: glycine dehydrogenase (aminomethyl-transferring), partial [Acidobacteriota bacterium]
MTMLRRVQGGSRSVFAVANTCFPHTIDVLRGRAEPLGIELVLVDPSQTQFDDRMFGMLVQTPDTNGALLDISDLAQRAHAAGVQLAVATDLLALALMTPPGEMGADVVLGSAQRFGVPMGYGGPHAAFFATRDRHVRQMPGRLIGVSIDVHGNRAYRMALQTREQHIRREKATSNICTAQALLATMATMYAVYHGPEGIRRIAEGVHGSARTLDRALRQLGCWQQNAAFFDTLLFRVPAGTRDAIRAAAIDAGFNFRYPDAADLVGIAVDETVGESEVEAVVAVFARGLGTPVPVPVSTAASAPAAAWPDTLRRTSPYLRHPVFHVHRSETAMMRYLKSLERKDVGLDLSMIPLGSCTMKLNAAPEMEPVTWPEFGRMHPFAPPEQAGGYAVVIAGLESAVREVTGFAAVSLQPNSG